VVKIGLVELPDFPLLLAPMEDISDPPFRELCKMYGADLMYTEFVSSDGLIRDAVKSLKKFDFSEHERPLGIQIFGHDIEAMKQAAAMAEKAKPDLIDLNFGCPVRKVVKKGAGAALLSDIPKMITIAAEVVKNTKLPVTAKTRLGWDEQNKPIVEIAERLQDVGIKAITIHGRTRAQMYTGKADWTLIGKVKENPHMYIPVFGNGDIDSPQKALEMKNTFLVDGIMIGRACVGNPWLFKEIKYFLKNYSELTPISLTEKIETCRSHILKSVAWKSERIGIAEMRKHYGHYFRGLYDFKKLRIKLMMASNINDVLDVIKEIEDKYSL
jgi:tRNA-dihydrouridine synthase B